MISSFYSGFVQRSCKTAGRSCGRWITPLRSLCPAKAIRRMNKGNLGLGGRFLIPTGISYIDPLFPAGSFHDQTDVLSFRKAGAPAAFIFIEQPAHVMGVKECLDIPILAITDHCQPVRLPQAYQRFPELGI